MPNKPLNPSGKQTDAEFSFLRLLSIQITAKRKKWTTHPMTIVRGHFHINRQPKGKKSLSFLPSPHQTGRIKNTPNQNERTRQKTSEMDRVFSVEEISDPFWSSSHSSSSAAESSNNNNNNNNNNKMNRSSSEWAFQRFLEEVSISQNNPSQSLSSTSSSLNETRIEIKDPPLSDPSLNDNGPIDPEEYQQILKKRLDLACAAVALSRVFLWFCVLGFFYFPCFLHRFWFSYEVLRFD